MVSSVPFQPAVPKPAQPVLPSAQIASFTNRGQIGALNAGLPAAGQQALLSPTQAALQSAVKKQSPVQVSANKQMTEIKKSNERLSDIARTLQSRKSGANYGGSLVGGLGQAWKPDGSLSDSRNRALSLASGYLGSPYVLGGTTTRGIDCSGLVMMVYNQLGYNLSHDSGQQKRNIPGVRTSVNNLRPGDLVYWKNSGHIAIYAGNGEIIEAPMPGLSVRRRKITNPGAMVGIALRLPGE